MRVFIITVGRQPIPAVRGGAVEQLLDQLIERNELDPSCEFTVFSCLDSEAEKKAAIWKNTQVSYIAKSSLFFKGKQFFWSAINRFFRQRYFGNAFIRKVISVAKKRTPPDLFIIENAPEFSIPLRRSFPRVLIVQHVHNFYLNNKEKRLGRIIECSDQFWMVSEFLRTELLKTGLVAEEKVKVWNNGIDVDAFHSQRSPLERVDLRGRHGVGAQDFLFLFVGRISPYKGVPEVLAAFSRISNAKLMLVGGYAYQGSNIPRSDNDDIIYTGFVSNHELALYYQAADVVVLPSISEEAFGLTVLEAMAAGASIVTTDAGGIPEVVGDVALVVTRGDGIVERLQQAMELLMSDEVLRDCLRRRAQKRAELFSQERFCERFKTLIESVK